MNDLTLPTQEPNSSNTPSAGASGTPPDEETWKIPEPAQDQSAGPSAVAPTTPVAPAQPLTPVPTVNHNPLPAPPTPIVASPAGPLPGKAPLPITATQKQPVVVPEHRGSAGKVILIFVSTLLILGGLVVGLMFTDDKGILSSGISAQLRFLPLSSLWGGLSANPQVAANQVATALRGNSSYSYSGTLKGSNSTTQSSSTSIIPSSQSESVDSLTTIPSTTVSSIDPLAASGQFTFVSVGSNYSLRFVVNDNGIDLTNEYRVIDGDVYLSQIFGTTLDTTSSLKSTDSVWLKAGQAPSFSVDTVRDRLADSLSKASYKGRFKVQEEEAYQYSAALSGADIPMIVAISSLESWKNSTGVVEVTVSRKTHLPLKVHVTLTDPITKKTVTLDAQTAVVQANQTIEVPQNAVDPSIIKTPDQVRKADLATIAEALTRYAKERGSYPLALTVERTDQTSSVVAQALVPSYLAVMPKDVNTAHYYGYTSDGKTYELSAVLEDSADPEGVKAGAVTLYTLKGPKSVDNTVLPQ